MATAFASSIGRRVPWGLVGYTCLVAAALTAGAPPRSAAQSALRMPASAVAGPSTAVPPTVPPVVPAAHMGLPSGSAAITASGTVVLRPPLVLQNEIRTERVPNTLAPPIPRPQIASCQDKDLMLSFPVSGRNGRDYVINNYTDLDAAAGSTRDYRNQTGATARTYDGHRGYDIDIPSFRQMDNSTAVVRAAAAGIVVFVDDSQPDRNQASLGSCTASWNVVQIRHGNGYTSFYGHMKRGSARVKVNDTVQAGTPLGVMGSSGCSTQPHLHFELHDCSDTFIEPAARNLWQSLPAYDAPSDVMDVWLVAGGAPSAPQIIDPPPEPTVFRPGSKLGFVFSLAFAGGVPLDVTVQQPDGAVFSAWTWSLPAAQRYGHAFATWETPLGEQVGTWTLEVRVNSNFRLTRRLSVSHYAPGLTYTRHHIPASEYQTFFADIVAAGFRPIWVQGYAVSGQNYFNALFRGGPSSGWRAKHDMDGPAFAAFCEESRQAGLAPMQIDSYLVGEQVRYAAIVAQLPTMQRGSYHGVTEAVHQQRFNEAMSRGFRPVNVSVVSVGGQRFFTALYDKTPVGGFLNRAVLTETELLQEHQTQRLAGRYLAYLDSYQDGDISRFSATWESQPRVDQAFLQPQHSVSSFQTEFERLAQLGYAPAMVIGYARISFGQNRQPAFIGTWNR